MYVLPGQSANFYSKMCIKFGLEAVGDKLSVSCVCRSLNCTSDTIKHLHFPLRIRPGSTCSCQGRSICKLLLTNPDIYTGMTLFYL